MFKIRYIVLSFLLSGVALYYAAIKCVTCETCGWCAYIAPITRLVDGKTERMKDYEIEGIDISKYQRAIGWDVVAKQGIDFAFVKATEGANLTDTHFGQNWTTIKQVGMKRGAYHFFRPTVSALAQAKNYLDKVPFEAGDLPPVLDAEDDDGASKEVIISRMQSWLDIVEKRCGTKPIIYTNLRFYYNYIVGNFDSYPLWIAKYSSVRPQLVNDKQFKIWQYGSKGRIEGIDGNVDLNVFLGDTEAFEKFCIQPKIFYTEAFEK
jgi:lysozyme